MPPRRSPRHPVKPGIYFVLDRTNKMAVPCNDLFEWATSFGTSDRVIQQTKIGDFLVSTVFLGLAHNQYEGRDPMLFETMVFFEGSDVDCRRYFTWDDAEKGHAEVCAWVQRKIEETNERNPADRDADRVGDADCQGDRSGSEPV